jgi:hypothetical protein
MADHIDCHFSFYNYDGKTAPCDKRFSYSIGGWSKYDSFGKLFETHVDFSYYEYFWFLDEDILLTEVDFEKLKSRINDGDFNIAQLAICEESYSKWSQLKQYNSKNLMRSVDFIEVMAPIFEKNALLDVKHTFPMSLSTWGLDHYWSRYHSKLFVFDDIKMSHLSSPDTLNGSYYKYLRSIGINPYLENLKLRFYAYFTL